MNERDGLPDISRTWHKGKCACASPERYECYFLRYPNQMELDGRDYCECPCHGDYNEDEEQIDFDNWQSERIDETYR